MLQLKEAEGAVAAATAERRAPESVSTASPMPGEEPLSAASEDMSLKAVGHRDQSVQTEALLETKVHEMGEKLLLVDEVCSASELLLCQHYCHFCVYIDS